MKKCPVLGCTKWSAAGNKQGLCLAHEKEQKVGRQPRQEPSNKKVKVARPNKNFRMSLALPGGTAASSEMNSLVKRRSIKIDEFQRFSEREDEDKPMLLRPSLLVSGQQRQDLDDDDDDDPINSPPNLSSPQETRSPVITAKPRIQDNNNNKLRRHTMTLGPRPSAQNTDGPNALISMCSRDYCFKRALMPALCSDHYDEFVGVPNKHLQQAANSATLLLRKMQQEYGEEMPAIVFEIDKIISLLQIGKRDDYLDGMTTRMEEAAVENEEEEEEEEEEEAVGEGEGGRRLQIGPVQKVPVVDSERRQTLRNAPVEVFTWLVRDFCNNAIDEHDPNHIPATRERSKPVIERPATENVIARLQQIIARRRLIMHAKKFTRNKDETEEWLGEQNNLTQIEFRSFSFVVKIMTRRFNSWEFDIFRWQSCTDGYPLSIMIFNMFERHNFFQEFDISRYTFANYITAIEEEYQDVPYHNNLHGTDVMRMVYYFCTANQTSQRISKQDLLAALLAGAVHDVAHPGTNNHFQIQTGSEHAWIYNDKSVLENMHISLAFRMLRKPGMNIFEKWPMERRKEVRKLMIEMVLATDMSHHQQAVEHARLRIAEEKRRLQRPLRSPRGALSPLTPRTVSNLLSPKAKGAFHGFASAGAVNTQVPPPQEPPAVLFPNPTADDKLWMLALIIHTADISTSSQIESAMIEWTRLLTQEFYEQGDREKELGLPVLAMMDRNKDNVAPSQLGFMDIVVEPLLLLLKTIEPTAMACVQQLRSNRKHWLAIIEKEKKDKEAGIVKKPEEVVSKESNIKTNNESKANKPSPPGLGFKVNPLSPPSSDSPQTSARRLQMLAQSPSHKAPRGPGDSNISKSNVKQVNGKSRFARPTLERGVDLGSAPREKDEAESPKVVVVHADTPRKPKMQLNGTGESTSPVSSGNGLSGGGDHDESNQASSAITSPTTEQPFEVKQNTDTATSEPPAESPSSSPGQQQQQLDSSSSSNGGSNGDVHVDVHNPIVQEVALSQSPVSEQATSTSTEAAVVDSSSSSTSTMEAEEEDAGPMRPQKIEEDAWHTEEYSLQSPLHAAQAQQGQQQSPPPQQQQQEVTVEVPPLEPEPEPKPLLEPAGSSATSEPPAESPSSSPGQQQQQLDSSSSSNGGSNGDVHGDVHNPIVQEVAQSQSPVSEQATSTSTEAAVVDSSSSSTSTMGAEEEDAGPMRPQKIEEDAWHTEEYSLQSPLHAAQAQQGQQQSPPPQQQQQEVTVEVPPLEPEPEPKPLLEPAGSSAEAEPAGPVVSAERTDAADGPTTTTTVLAAEGEGEGQQGEKTEMAEEGT